jgi:hypothetical protein
MKIPYIIKYVFILFYFMVFLKALSYFMVFLKPLSMLKIQYMIYIVKVNFENSKCEMTDKHFAND